jgi:2-iminobutanoate/2-iminopropanoate deaminase
VTSVRTLHTTVFGRAPEYSPWSAGKLVPASSTLLFTPGMTARDLNGVLIAPGNVRGQTERIFEQLAAILKEAGGSMSDVVKLTVFLADMTLAADVQKVRNRIWPTDPPVSSTVKVELVAPEVLVEIEAVAVVP